MYLEHAGPQQGHGSVPTMDSERSEALAHVSIRYVSHLNPATRQTLSTLTPEDYREFAPIRHTPTRERSLATRALLRTTLSEVDGNTPPEAWVFTRDAYGKPALANQLTDLHFSCSHTMWVSVVAVSRRPIGIDIESSSLSVDDAFLAEYYSAQERRDVARKPIANRASAYARLWTLKEAVAKILGTGLALPLSQLEFENEEDRLSYSSTSEINGSELQLATWSLPNKAHPLSVALAIRR